MIDTISALIGAFLGLAVGIAVAMVVNWRWYRFHVKQLSRKERKFVKRSDDF